MSTLLTINRVYYLIGFIVMLLVVMTLRDRGNPKRFTTALFWFLFGGIFLFGDLLVQELGRSLAYRIIGGAVIVIALLAGFGLVGKGHYKMSTEEEREASSRRLGNWLFLPALLIPVVTVIGTLFLKGVSVGGVFLLDQKQLTLAALCVACVGGAAGGLVAHARHAAACDSPVAPTGGYHRLGDNFAADAGDARRGVCRRRYRHGGAARSESVRRPGKPLHAGGYLLHRHGAFHDDHGQRVCGVPGAERGHRAAAVD